MVGTTPDAKAANADVPVVLLQGIRDELNHAIPAVARSLGRIGVPVFVVSAERPRAAGRSRYVRGCATLDLTTATPQQLVDTVDALVGQSLRTILLPMDDVAALFVEDVAEVRERGSIPARPTGLVRQLTDKRALTALLATLGIPTPAIRAVPGEDELGEAVRVFGFPAVLKAADPLVLRRAPGGSSVKVAPSMDALLREYRSMRPEVRASAILQEHIAGGAHGDWIFNGCFTEAGDCCFHGTGVKLRQWPLRTGAATLGVTLPNAVVSELSMRLARSVSFGGVIDIDFRYDPRDGSYKLLDVNPRIGSSFRLFVSENGIDLARAHYLQTTGQLLGRAEARPGRKWLVEPRDLRSCLELLVSGSLGPREWLSSVAGVEETAWFDAEDVRPFAAMVSHYASRLVRRAA